MTKKFTLTVMFMLMICALTVYGSAVEAASIYGGGVLSELSFAGESAETTGIFDRLKDMWTRKQTPQSYAGEEVYLGGFPVGIEMNREGIAVANIIEVVTNKGAECPLKDSGIQIGDRLIAIDGTKINSVKDIRTALDATLGEVILTVLRGEERFSVSVMPSIDALTSKRVLGVQVQSDINGIGTCTFVRKNGRYGALGHMIAIGKEHYGYGSIFPAEINGIKKGQKNATGALLGSFSGASSRMGSVDANTVLGIYGDWSYGEPSSTIKVAGRDEVQVGTAYIYTTLSGDKPDFYEIQIVKVNDQSSPQEKSMVLFVTDERLKDQSGGIVQGMSGSPIVQNNRLVGAVTHVFTNDPTRGYGVFADWMLFLSDQTKQNSTEIYYDMAA